MNRFLRLVGLVCVVGSISAGSFADSSSLVVRVSKNSSANLDDYHYTSIQSAIDSLTATSSAAPGVVIVYPGTYTENITLSNDYVSIVGMGPEETIIAPSDTLSPTIDVSVETSKTSLDNVLRGFSVLSTSSSPAIRVSGPTTPADSEDDLLLQDVHAASTGGDALEVTSGTNFKVLDSILQGAGGVVLVSSASSGSILSITNSELILSSTATG